MGLVGDPHGWGRVVSPRVAGQGHYLKSKVLELQKGNRKRGGKSAPAGDFMASPRPIYVKPCPVERYFKRSSLSNAFFASVMLDFTEVADAGLDRAAHD